MHPTRDHLLPPDPEAYRRAAHPRGRVIVIAPTRAACETIELALGLRVETVLEREHGQELRAWAGGGRGFGIVAGTGVGKTLGIRANAETILGEPLRVGVVNREREATPDTPTWNVVIVTTGIARRWFEDDLISGRDTLVVDEIHQTSAELELCLALGKRARCRFIWLSATVDPAFYARYLDSADVLVTQAFDPALKAKYGNTLALIGGVFARYQTTIMQELTARMYASNKLVAKIASDFGKPDGITVVRPEEVQPFLDPLRIRVIPGIGPKTERFLHERHVRTVADLRTLERAQLAVQALEVPGVHDRLAANRQHVGHQDAVVLAKPQRHGSDGLHVLGHALPAQHVLEERERRLIETGADFARKAQTFLGVVPH